MQYISNNVHNIYIQQNLKQFKTKWLKCKQEVLSAHVQQAK